MATKTDRAAFEAVFTELAQDILDHAKKYNLPDNAMQWLEKVPHQRQPLRGSPSAFLNCAHPSCPSRASYH
jgi:hypothetical protein